MPTKETWRSGACREIVDDDSEDIWDHDKISLTDARKIEPDFEVGEEVSEQMYIEDFGRRAVTTARQTLIQKVKDLGERHSVSIRSIKIW